MLCASSASRWSMEGCGSDEIFGMVRGALVSVQGNRSAADLLLRRCIFGPWRLEAEILQLRCNREEIIFSLQGLIETYIENNSSQPPTVGAESVPCDSCRYFSTC